MRARSAKSMGPRAGGSGSPDRPCRTLNRRQGNRAPPAGLFRPGRFHPGFQRLRDRRRLRGPAPAQGRAQAPVRQSHRLMAGSANGRRGTASIRRLGRGPRLALLSERAAQRQPAAVARQPRPGPAAAVDRAVEHSSRSAVPSPSDDLRRLSQAVLDGRRSRPLAGCRSRRRASRERRRRAGCDHADRDKLHAEAAWGVAPSFSQEPGGKEGFPCTRYGTSTSRCRV